MKMVEVTLSFPAPTQGPAFDSFWKDKPDLETIEFAIEDAIEMQLIADYGTVEVQTLVIREK